MPCGWRSIPPPEDLNNPLLESTNWGLSADPDADGLANALEFYAGGDPRFADAEMLLTSSLEKSTLRMRLRRSLGAGGITLIPESSSDLSTWSTDPELAGEVFADGHPWMEVALPATGQPEFIRWRVE